MLYLGTAGGISAVLTGLSRRDISGVNRVEQERHPEVNLDQQERHPKVNLDQQEGPTGVNRVELRTHRC